MHECVFVLVAGDAVLSDLGYSACEVCQFVLGRDDVMLCQYLSCDNEPAASAWVGSSAGARWACP